MWEGMRWASPPTFHVVPAKFLSNHPKTVCQILTDSFLTVAFCQTVRRGVSAKFQPHPLLKNIESPVYFILFLSSILCVMVYFLSVGLLLSFCHQVYSKCTTLVV